MQQKLECMNLALNTTYYFLVEIVKGYTKKDTINYTYIYLQYFKPYLLLQIKYSTRQSLNNTSQIYLIKGVLPDCNIDGLFIETANTGRE